MPGLSVHTLTTLWSFIQISISYLMGEELDFFLSSNTCPKLSTAHQQPSPRRKQAKVLGLVAPTTPRPILAAGLGEAECWQPTRLLGAEVISQGQLEFLSEYMHYSHRLEARVFRRLNVRMKIHSMSSAAKLNAYCQKCPDIRYTGILRTALPSISAWSSRCKTLLMSWKS